MSASGGGTSLDGLLAEVQALQDGVRRAFAAAPHQTLTSSDPSGAVTLELSGHGRRVTRVAVAANWRDRVTPESLGAAVLEAALRPQLQQVSDLLAGVGPHPAGVGPAYDPPVRPSAFAPLDLQASLGWNGLGRMLEVVQRAIVTLERTGPGPAPVIAPVVGRSANRRVSVSLIGGQLSDVTVDAGWAGGVGRQQLSDAFNEAFEDGYAGPQTEPGTGPADELAGVLVELQDVMSRLGLTLPAGAAGAAGPDLDGPGRPQ